LRASLTNSKVREILDRVDWNFPSSTAIPTSVHALHWFPGNFIPQIPSFLIQALSTRQEFVADPFAGSGTTGIEGLLLGRRVWLGDANSIAVSIAKAKASLLTNADVRQNFEAESRNLLKLSFRTSVSAEMTRLELHPELATWFHPDTFSQLIELWSRIESVDGSELREVFRVAFSDVLFSCASSGRPLTSGGHRRRHHWGWIADNVKPRIFLWHDANRLFRTAVEAISETIRAYRMCEASHIAIERADARSIPLESSSVDLVVTSPPYLAMIDYSTAQRLTYMWRGLPMDNERRQELGARWRRNRLSEAADYESAMSLSVSEIERVLKPSALCAIVIGASRKFPDMAEKVIASFAANLETVWGPTPRTPTRRRVSVRQGEAPTEYICVFRKNS
jgi:DNA methylase